MIRHFWALTVRAVLVASVGLVAADAVIIAIAYPYVAGLGLAAASWRKVRRVWRMSDSYGSARFASRDDLVRAHMVEPRGVILGKLDPSERPSRSRAVRTLLSPSTPSEWAARQCLAAHLGPSWTGDVFIRTKAHTHLLTVAPSGGGKTTHTLGPNLLAHEGNCIVVDPKGELFALSADHRRRKFGHQIIRLDPAGLLGPGAQRFNPLDFIDPESADFRARCVDLANMLVVRTGREDDPHWNDSAENVIAAFLSYIAACEGDGDSRNLRGLRMFLASRDLFDAGKAAMGQIDGFGGVLRQFGHSLSWHQEREGASVMSNVQRHTSIFDDPLIAHSTALTNWNPKALRSGRMTVYLTVPSDRLVVWAAWQRMVLGSLIRVITRGVPNERNPALLLVDECANIGHMQALEDAVMLQRGAGLRAWLFFQSLAQLKKCFGDNADTVLDNLGTQQYFAINSHATAKELSERIGEHTVAVQSGGGSTGASWPIGATIHNQRSRNSGTSYNTSEIGRRLLKPEEILCLSDDVVLIFHRNLPVIPAGRIRYYADRAFRRGGTGRTRGLGLGAMVAALAALAVVAFCSVPLFSLAMQAGVPNPFTAPVTPNPYQPSLDDTSAASEPPPLGTPLRLERRFPLPAPRAGSPLWRSNDGQAYRNGQGFRLGQP